MKRSRPRSGREWSEAGVAPRGWGGPDAPEPLLPSLPPSDTNPPAAEPRAGILRPDTPGGHRALPRTATLTAPSFPLLGTQPQPLRTREKEGEVSPGAEGGSGRDRIPLGIPGITTWGRKRQEGGSAGGHSAGEDSQTVKVAIPRHHFSPLISLH